MLRADDAQEDAAEVAFDAEAVQAVAGRFLSSFNVALRSIHDQGTDGGG